MREIPFGELPTSDLIVDAIYQSDREAPRGALGGEPLSKLMRVGNLGGFRSRKGKSGILYSVLTSTGVEPEWPDSLDIFTGIYSYYGDNRKPGREMHDTKQKGNQLLRESFALANSESESDRRNCPVFFIFEWAGKARDHIFRGMAIPGTGISGRGEDLVAVWRTNGGQRFQNYRARFTVLNDGFISGEWLRSSITAGELLVSHPNTPESWRIWVEKGKVMPLLANRATHRSVSDQSPQNEQQDSVLQAIKDHCAPDPWLFEKVAAEIWKMSSPSAVKYELTRKFRDGGRDAIGQMIVGPNSDPIQLTFALEAKLYSTGNNIGVKEISRLISRIKHREFGVFVTTSAVSAQAYGEVRDDGHPIVIIAARDICEILAQHGITDAPSCISWMRSVTS